MYNSRTHLGLVQNSIKQFNNLHKIFIYSSQLTKCSMEITLAPHSSFPMWYVLCTDFWNDHWECGLHLGALPKDSAKLTTPWKIINKGVKAAWDILIIYCFSYGYIVSLRNNSWRNLRSKTEMKKSMVKPRCNGQQEKANNNLLECITTRVMSKSWACVKYQSL